MVGWLVVFGLGLLAFTTPKGKLAPKTTSAALPPAADVPLTLPDMYTIVELAAKYEVDRNVLLDLEQRLAALSSVDASWAPYHAKIQTRLAGM